jgi:RIO-like serine/threonine protein kinase
MDNWSLGDGGEGTIFGGWARMSRVKVLKDHPLSRVWIDGGWLYKWQPKFLTENEIWCLEKIYLSRFVPYAERVELEIIRMEFIEDEAPTNGKLLLKHTDIALQALAICGIRHGDLTRPNVLVKDNRPILLDFSESRLVTDPRPDKRPGSDKFWLKCTVQEILIGNS